MSTHVSMVAAPNCVGNLRFIDKATLESSDAGVSDAEPGTTAAVTVTVPGDKVLALACTGPEGGECALTITAVDPPLPADVTQGTPQAVQEGTAVTNPPNPPAIGTPILVACTTNVVLWTGSSSYVTVRFRGTALCQALVKTDLGSEELTDNRPFCRTFGPVTSLTGFCEGTGNTVCEFQVTETIQLP